MAHDDAHAAPAAPFTILLRASDVPRRPTWTSQRRVVCLHGWLQDHTCWLPTAHRLRVLYGHDVLLLDWMAHGLSDTPAPADMHIDALLEQMRSALERVGWAGDTAVPTTLAGCSLGGALAMRYTSRYPAEVERLVLVAPAGFDEPWWQLSRAGRTAARALDAVASAAGSRSTVAAHAHLIRETPRYGVERDWFNSEAARDKPIMLVAAAFDELHSAHRNVNGRKGDPSFRQRRLPLMHAMLCLTISWLRLELDERNWHEPRPAARL